MTWSSFLHVLTVIIGVLGLIAGIMGWFMPEASFLGQFGNNLESKATFLILVAIWLGLGTLIHQVKEDQEA